MENPQEQPLETTSEPIVNKEEEHDEPAKIKKKRRPKPKLPAEFPERKKIYRKTNELILEYESPISEFDWRKYLVQEISIPAPLEFFYQSADPPENKFQIGHRLAMPDISNDLSNYCIGEVTHVCKVWIRLKLLGTDNSFCQFFIVDDPRLKAIIPDDQPLTDPQLMIPVSRLQVPGLFRQGHTMFKKFRDANVKDLAPIEAFNPISSTLHPGSNRFDVGMKLEAVDERSFNGTISAATIDKVDGDYVTVHFDGWPKKHDNRIRYDSRSIFPIGYAWRAKIILASIPDPPKNSKISLSTMPPAIGAENIDSISSSSPSSSQKEPSELLLELYPKKNSEKHLLPVRRKRPLTYKEEAMKKPRNEEELLRKFSYDSRKRPDEKEEEILSLLIQAKKEQEELERQQELRNKDLSLLVPLMSTSFPSSTSSSPSSSSIRFVSTKPEYDKRNPRFPVAPSSVNRYKEDPYVVNRITGLLNNVKDKVYVGTDQKKANYTRRDNPLLPANVPLSVIAPSVNEHPVDFPNLDFFLNAHHGLDSPAFEYEDPDESLERLILEIPERVEKEADNFDMGVKRKRGGRASGEPSSSASPFGVKLQRFVEDEQEEVKEDVKPNISSLDNSAGFPQANRADVCSLSPTKSNRTEQNAALAPLKIEPESPQKVAKKSGYIVEGLPKVTIYINKYCRASFLNAENVALNFPYSLKQKCIIHGFRELMQLFADHAIDTKEFLSQVEMAPEGITSITVPYGVDKCCICSLPVITTKRQMWEVIDRFLSKMGTCSNFISPNLLTDTCPKCDGEIPESEKDNIRKALPETVNVPDSVAECSRSSPSRQQTRLKEGYRLLEDMDREYFAHFVRDHNLLDSDTIETLYTQRMDGRSLMELSASDLRTHCNFPLGVEIKVLNVGKEIRRITGEPDPVVFR